MKSIEEEKNVSFLEQQDWNFLSVPTLATNRLSVTSAALSDVPSEIIIRSRIKYGSRWSAYKGLLMEYSKSTSIHGIRYLFEVHRPIYEKSYWIVLLATSLYFATSLCWDTFVKWQESPVILGFDETLVPVHQIPFPTVTICPEIKMDTADLDFIKVSQQIRREVREYGTFRNNANLTEDQLSKFAATLQICEVDIMKRFAEFIPRNVKPEIAKTLVQLSVSKNVTGPFCKWNGRFYFCDSIFSMVATDEGICFQINGLRAKDIYRDERYISYHDEEEPDFNRYFYSEVGLNNITGEWSLEYGYVGQGYNAYPQRTVFASVRNALFVFLQGFEHNLEYECRSYKQGYRVFLNSPESAPLTTGNYILVPHNREVMVSVLPRYVVSSSSLRTYSPEKRQCYFNNERFLRYFRSYSQNNCQIECLTNFTITKCGCVKFWMPKPLDVPVCQLSDMTCYIEAQEELGLLLQNQTMQHIVDRSKKIMCDCMPACTSLDYNFEISNADYDMEKTIRAQRDIYEHSDLLASRLSVYFKERQFTAIKRTIHFSFTTLIAHWGGIFGLFMGISSLSIIELIYFFSVRLIVNLRKRRTAKRKLGIE